MTTLELTVDEGRGASAAHFFQTGSHLVDLLDELADVPVDWLITDLHLGSAVVAISAPLDQPEADATLAATVHGLTLVSGGSPLPRTWRPDAVRAARRFAETPATDAATPRAHLRLVTDDECPVDVQLDARLASTLATLQPFERTMPGSVRGYLVGMTVSRGNRASVRLPTGRVVRVGFADDLRPRLKESLLQDVELTGETRQDDDDQVFHIRADAVRVLTTPRLSWTELFGFDPDITGGLSVEQYLENSRGEA